MGSEAWSMMSATNDVAARDNAYGSNGTSVVHVWDEEARKIKAPELYSLMPEAILHFLQKYVAYAEKLHMYAQCERVQLNPITIKQCMSVPLLVHLVATELPEAYRGMGAAEVPAVVVHDYIVGVIDKERHIQRRWAMLLLKRISINMSPGQARLNVERGFMRLWAIIAKYKTGLKPKRIVQIILENM